MRVFAQESRNSSVDDRISTFFPLDWTGSTSLSMTRSMSPPRKPLLTKTTLFLPPVAASRADEKERTGDGSAIPNLAGGINKFRANDLDGELVIPFLLCLMPEGEWIRT